MADLIAWRTDEKIAADIDRQPRHWLTVGSGRIGGKGIVKIEHCLFVLEGEQAQNILGLDLAQFPNEPVRVTLKLETLE